MQPSTYDGVHLYPRRKAGEHVVPERGRMPLCIDRVSVQAMFDTPQALAAKRLGVSLTALKRVCRKLGIHRWPFVRKSKFTKEARAALLVDSDACAGPTCDCPSDEDHSCAGTTTQSMARASPQDSEGFQDRQNDSTTAFVTLPVLTESTQPWAWPMNHGT